MTRTSLLPVLVVSAALAAAQSLGAQTSAKAAYDPSAETTVAGVVDQVLSGAGADGTIGVHLTVNTEHGLVDVQVAPAAFIGENNYWFENGDRVTVVGARAKARVGFALWARAITKNGKTLVLRDDAGQPLWKTSGAGDGCGVSHPPMN